MKIVVGLGNPGPKYETTRHNAGFLAIDRLIDHWNFEQRGDQFQSELFEGKVGEEKVLLLKPFTYMNLSGRAVAPLLNFYKLKPSDLLVIHDDLDIPSCTLRVKIGGSAGGHNGLKSLDSSLGDQNYWRIRIGIGRSEPSQLKIPGEDFVLMPFSDEELEKLDLVLEDVVSATKLILSGDPNQAMNLFNRKSKKESGDGL